MVVGWVGRMDGVLEVKGALVFIFSSFFSFLSSHSHRGIKYRLRYGISLRLGNGLDIGITTGGPTTLSKDMDIMMGGCFCSCLVLGLCGIRMRVQSIALPIPYRSFRLSIHGGSKPLQNSISTLVPNSSDSDHSSNRD